VITKEEAELAAVRLENWIQYVDELEDRIIDLRIDDEEIEESFMMLSIGLTNFRPLFEKLTSPSSSS